MSRYVNIGIVSSTHGVRGWAKVAPMTDDPERFTVLERVFIAAADGSGRRSYDIEDVKFQTQRVLVKFKGVDTPEQAAALKGRFIQITEEETPKIEEEDTYYHYQLEGLTVADEDGGILGKVEAIIRTGSNDVYVVRAPDGKTEYMVPALKSCIRSIDLERGLMVVDREWVV